MPNPLIELVQILHKMKNSSIEVVRDGWTDLQKFDEEFLLYLSEQVTLSNDHRLICPVPFGYPQTPKHGSWIAYQLLVYGVKRNLRKHQNLTILNLAGLAYSDILDEIHLFKSLKRLNLSDGQHQGLPATLAAFKQLELLDVSNNPLKDLPVVLFSLPVLNRLSVSGCGLTSLPEDLSALQDLTELDVSNNRLSEFPWSLLTLSKITELKFFDNPISLLTLVEDRKLENVRQGLDLVAQLDQFYSGEGYSLSHRLFGVVDINPETRKPYFVSQGSLNLSQKSYILHWMLGVSAQQNNLWMERQTDLLIQASHPIPDNLGHLQALRVLHIEGSSSEKIPPVIFQFENLFELCIKDSNLKTIAPEISQLQKLRKLVLHKSKLDTVVPELTQLSHLEHLDISDNQLTELPAGFSHLQQLQHLDLHKNQLLEIPSGLSFLTKIRSLFLQHNKIHTIAVELSNFLCLETLDLSHNNLQEFPELVLKLPKLKDLSIQNNPIAAFSILQEYQLSRVKQGLRELQNLKEKYSEHSFLIDTSMPTLKVPQYVYGTTIRPYIKEKSRHRTYIALWLLAEQARLENPVVLRIKGLDLSNQRLTELPDNLVHMRNLETINLINNSFSVFPKVLTQLPKLFQLFFSGNTRVKEFPNNLRTIRLNGYAWRRQKDAILKIKGLEYLSLSNANLSSLPQEILAMPNLKVLRLGRHCISNTQPFDKLLQASYRQILNQRNRSLLCGKDDPQLQSFKRLEYQQNMPASQLELLPYMTKLTHVSLCKLNKKQGQQLPESFQGQVSLVHLELSQNNLMKAPTGLSDTIKSIVLDGNQITHIPDEYGQLSKLQQLDLRHNPIAYLPDTLSALQVDTAIWTAHHQQIINSKSLRYLDVSGVENLDLSTLKELIPRLEKLTIHHQQFATIPFAAFAIDKRDKLCKKISPQLAYVGEPQTNVTQAWLGEYIRRGAGYVVSLRLSLDEVPENLHELTDLTYLTLYAKEQQRKSVPDNVYRLPALKQVSLHGLVDATVHVPAGWESLAITNSKDLLLQPDATAELALQKLYISSSTISNPQAISLFHELGELHWEKRYPLQTQSVDLQVSFSSLNKLHTLILSELDLRALPSLSTVRALSSLDISHNKLTSFPELKGLEKLTAVDISHNTLTSLPNSIGDLTQLQKLNFSSNPLQKLPQSLCKLTQVPYITLADTVTVIPTWVEKGKLSKSQYHKYDKSNDWKKLSSLTDLSLPISGKISSNLLSMPSLQRLEVQMIQLMDNFEQYMRLHISPEIVEMYPAIVGRQSNWRNHERKLDIHKIKLITQKIDAGELDPNHIRTLSFYDLDSFLSLQTCVPLPALRTLYVQRHAGAVEQAVVSTFAEEGPRVAYPKVIKKVFSWNDGTWDESVSQWQASRLPQYYSWERILAGADSEKAVSVSIPFVDDFVAEFGKYQWPQLKTVDLPHLSSQLPAMVLPFDFKRTFYQGAKRYQLGFTFVCSKQVLDEDYRQYFTLAKKDKYPYLRRRVSAAMGVWRKWAQKGNGDAIFLVAKCYEAGIGCKKSIDMANEYYRRGSEFDHVYCLGNYSNSVEKSKNYKKVMVLRERAANLGSATAMYNLALLYNKGPADISRDVEKAKGWFEKAMFAAKKTRRDDIIKYAYKELKKLDGKQAETIKRKVEQAAYEPPATIQTVEKPSQEHIDRWVFECFVHTFKAGRLIDPPEVLMLPFMLQDIHDLERLSGVSPHLKKVVCRASKDVQKAMIEQVSFDSLGRVQEQRKSLSFQLVFQNPISAVELYESFDFSQQKRLQLSISSNIPLCLFTSLRRLTVVGSESCPDEFWQDLLHCQDLTYLRFKDFSALRLHELSLRKLPKLQELDVLASRLSRSPYSLLSWIDKVVWQPSLSFQVKDGRLPPCPRHAGEIDELAAKHGPMDIYHEGLFLWQKLTDKQADLP